MAIGTVTPVGTGADLIHRGSSSDAPLRAIGILLLPLALVLKNWHYISIVLPYLALGIVALLALGWALGLVGLVLRGGFVIAVALYRFITACVEAFREPVSESADESTHESSHATFSDPSFSDPYQVLGLDKAASRSDLLNRYRQLMSANHPDKVAQLDPEIQAFASERSRRIIQAYEEITAQNSW